jgi:hypothetical protein
MKTKNIFKNSVLLVLLALAALAGCKNDSVLGPNGNNQVSFQISQQNGQNGGVEFIFQPSVDTKISRVISKLPAQQFADTINAPNPNYLYSKDSLYFINEYIGVQNGQQWNFDFTGTVPGMNNSNYTVTANYTVQ